jgi:hypothetical protein
VTPPAAYVQLAGPMAVPGAPSTGAAIRTNTAPGAIAPPPGSNLMPPLPPLEDQLPVPRPLPTGPAGKLAP